MTAQELKPTTIAVVGATTPAGRALVMELARGELTVLDPLLHEFVDGQMHDRQTPEARALRRDRPVTLRLLCTEEPEREDEDSRYSYGYRHNYDYWRPIEFKQLEDRVRFAVQCLEKELEASPMSEAKLTVECAPLETLFEGADFIFIMGGERAQDFSLPPLSWERESAGEHIDRYLAYAKALDETAPKHARVLVVDDAAWAGSK